MESEESCNESTASGYCPSDMLPRNAEQIVVDKSSDEDQDPMIFGLLDPNCNYRYKYDFSLRHNI